MNSGFLITDVGLTAATVSTPTGPFIHITQFRVGSAVNYTPSRAMTGLQGTTLYTGVPNAYTVVDSDTIEVLLTMDPTVGTFDFGEVGVYLQSGELFALCVFDVMQQQVRAVGNQAGSVWKIRARLKLAQAATIVQVTLINSQSILEVPNWPSLAAPVNQVNDANIAIVHEDNSYGQSITVVRNADREWTLLDYTRIFNGSIPGTGSLDLTSTYFINTELPQVTFEDANIASPRADSRYVIKFADGSIRRVTYVDGFTVYWAGTISPVLGPVSIWEVNGGLARINWADTEEFNWFATEFNKYWANPIGPGRSAGPSQVAYPTLNKGKGQTPVALLTRRTNSTDWNNLKAKVLLNCALHGISTTDIAAASDFVYRPLAPSFPGMYSLHVLWDAFKAKIANLETNRNVFSNAYVDQLQVISFTDSTHWYGKRFYEFALTFDSEVQLQALLNSGYEVGFDLSISNVNNTAWTLGGIQGVAQEISGCLVRAGSTLFGDPGGSPFNNPVGMQHRVAATWTNLITSTWGQFGLQVDVTTLGPTGLKIRFGIDNSAMSATDYAGVDATFNWSVFSRKPSNSILNDPVLLHPVSTSSYIDDTFA